MVGVLYPNRDMPLPNLPFHVSINTVVSILSTILKACAAFILAEGISDSKWKWFRNDKPLHDLVVFDNASRGPWGCLKLLIALRRMHPVASLGAALAILVLVLDPFTQQLLHYCDCKQASTEANATLPRSTMYSEVGSYTVAFSLPPAAPVLSFIDQGLYNPTDVKTPFVCATGNCTFDQLFSTLGFCATCEDMSSKLTFTNVTVTIQTDQTFWVNTTLPSGVYAAAQPSFHMFDSWFVMNLTDEWIEVIQASQAFPGAGANWRKDHHYVMKMRPHSQYGYPDITGCTDWGCVGFGGAGAARCKIDPCVKTYRADIENGHLQEELVRSQKMFRGHSQDGNITFLAADLTCARLEAVSRLQGAGFRVGKDDVVIPWNVRVNASDGKASIPTHVGDPDPNIEIPGPLLNETDLPLDIIPADCIYSMGSDAVYSIQEYLAIYLNGNIGHSNGPPQIRAIFNDSYASFSSINRTFNSIAEGITQRIRSVRAEDVHQGKVVVVSLSKCGGDFDDGVPLCGHYTGDRGAKGAKGDGWGRLEIFAFAYGARRFEKLEGDGASRKGHNG
ncbi:hypothetical protein PG999_014036 [Apiospora kogelbergensis]|uniref:Uncharacterized protein n=1 Tax=Apiospora kogelbergensis TaxID=1337665 RepID=A0AAW0QBS6_9PEZI